MNWNRPLSTKFIVFGVATIVSGVAMNGICQTGIVPRTSAIEEKRVTKSIDESELVRRSRLDYQFVIHGVCTRLRAIQGISANNPSDIRLTGAPVNSLWGEFETPKRISTVEEDWIILAGEIRAASFSNLLLNRIADGRELVPINARSMLPPDPVMIALCRIGEPAGWEAIKRIPLEPDSQRQKKMTSLAQSTLGNSKARSALSSLKATIDDTLQSERISAAIAQIDADSR